MKDKTTIIIAHCLATLKQMDRILVFDNGKIVKNGKLETILQIDSTKYLLKEYEKQPKIEKYYLQK